MHRSLPHSMAPARTEDNAEAAFPVATGLQRYSVFTAAEKWCIVAMVAFAAWFSTLSNFIYYPAIHLLSTALSVSVDQVNLTVTSYMAVATIAPTLVGDAADVLGRRPMYMITLSLYFIANIAIALSRSYQALLGLRVLQALAISGKRTNMKLTSLDSNRFRNIFHRLWSSCRCSISCGERLICERHILRVRLDPMPKNSTRLTSSQASRLLRV
jgi:hypothetical protein